MSAINRKRNTTIVAATILAFSAITVLLAPAGFGGTWKQHGGMIGTPVIEGTSTTTYTGCSTDFAVSTDTMSSGTTMFRHHHIPGSRMDTTQNISIYSEPAGITYNGPMSGTADVVAADVAAGMPAGQATVYMQTSDGQIASTTIVVEN